MPIGGEGLRASPADAFAVVLLQACEVAVGDRDHLLPRQTLRRRDRLEPYVFQFVLVHGVDVVRAATARLEVHRLDFGDASELDPQSPAHEEQRARFAHPVDRAGPHRSPRSRTGHQRRGQHREATAVRGGWGSREARRSVGQVPTWVRPEPGRRNARSTEDLHPDVRCDRRGDHADVLRARRAVWLVPRTALDHAVAAALADRRHARPAADRTVAQHHAHDWRDPARRDRRQARHPPDRLREVVGGGGDESARRADSGGPRPPAADSDDDLRAGRRYGASGPRWWRGRRLSCPTRDHGHWRRGHVDVVDTARDSDGIRDSGRYARLVGRSAVRQEARGSDCARGAACPGAQTCDRTLARSLELTAMHNPLVPESLEGWSVLHLMYRVRWDRLRHTPAAEVQHLADEAMKALAVPDAGATASVQVLGHKADVMFICFRRDFEQLASAQLALSRTALHDHLEATTSYVSIIELGMYEMTGKIHEQLGTKFKPGSEE